MIEYANRKIIQLQINPAIALRLFDNSLEKRSKNTRNILKQQQYDHVNKELYYKSWG